MKHRDYVKIRMKLIANMDQLIRGVENHEPVAIEDARRLLAKTAVSGSPEALAQTLRGLLHEWDSEKEQAAWDKMRKEE